MWLVCALAGTARAQPASDAFDRAAATMAAGDYAAAADQFEALARAHPDDALADDALAKAAQLREQRLGEIDRAIELYRLVIERYPRARVARRAETRLAALTRERGAGPADVAALSQLKTLLSGYADRPRAATIAAMRALVNEHPQAPAAERARMWLGNAYLQDGWVDESVRWYREAQRTTSDPELRMRARKAEGDAHLAGGAWDEARAAYRDLAGSSDPQHRLWAEQSFENLAIAERRARIARWAWLVVLGFLIAMVVIARVTAGDWRTMLRGWARPPTELYYLVPAAVVVGGASLRSNEIAARAILFLFGGALVVTWLSGSTLDLARARGRRITWVRAVGHALLAAAAIGALCYLALMNDRLLDLLGETWAHGPER